jgi:APA family basic amino acid/polyamine antiporter
MPVGIIASLIICTILYIAVCAVMTGVVPYPELDTAAPASFVLEYIGSRLGSAIVGTGALCGLSTVLLVMIYAQTRAFYAMSRDGLIPEALCRIHSKYRTPHIITMIVGTVVALISGFTPIHIVAEMCSAGTLFAFMCSCAGILVLRRVYPTEHRDFRCPAVYIVAPLGLLFCGFVFSQLSSHTLYLFTGWSLLGIVIYALYSHRHSLLM